MVAALQKQQHNASIAHTKTKPHNHRANKKAGLLSLFSLENSLVLASASSRFLPFLSSLCVWTQCPLPASCFLAACLVTCCGASPESCLFISLPPTSVAAVCMLCCVLIDEMLEVSWDFFSFFFWCGRMHVFDCIWLLFCALTLRWLKMSTYWISVDPAALVS